MMTGDRQRASTVMTMTLDWRRPSDVRRGDHLGGKSSPDLRAVTRDFISMACTQELV